MRSTSRRVSDVRELLDTARADVESGWLPSCQLAVARDGELVVFETFGDATNDTRFCIFSCTKPIVASAVWLLIGDGLLDVPRPVAEYVPEFATNGKDAITVEQVMLHTSGFPNAAMPALDGADPAPPARAVREVGARVGAGHALRVPRDLGALGARRSHRAAERHRLPRLHRAARVATPLGLPRLLGIPEGEQDDIASLVDGRRRTAPTS